MESHVSRAVRRSAATLGLLTLVLALTAVSLLPCSTPQPPAASPRSRSTRGAPRAALARRDARPAAARRAGAAARGVPRLSAGRALHLLGPRSSPTSKPLAAASPRVKMWEYGQHLRGAAARSWSPISSPENLARLEEIRDERLRLADPGALDAGERERHRPAARRLVVWLAYGVHGNESSSSEAAMGAAYVLAAAPGRRRRDARQTSSC